MNPAAHPAVRVRLRPTRPADLPYVLRLEHDPSNLPAVLPWELAQHEAALRFPDFRHFMLEAGPGLEPAGFVILSGCRSPHQTIELKRLVSHHKGLGHGRAALRLVKQLVFDDLQAHRLWFEVRERSVATRTLAESEGFVLEGRLRDAVRTVADVDADAPARESLLLLSMLTAEFGTRRAQRLELLG